VKKDSDDEAGEDEPKVVPTPTQKKNTAPPAAESLLPSQKIALDLARNEEKQAAQVKERPTDPQGTPDLIARLGYAEGLARLDKYADAERLARMPGPAVDRLRTWLALADVAQAAGKNAEAARCAHEALNVFESELKKSKISPWHVWQLSRALARAGGNETKSKELADAIADAPLQGRAQLEIFLLQLEGNKGRVDPSSIDAKITSKSSLAYGLALEEITRRNAEAGTGGEEERVGEMAEGLQPFVLLGAARGTQHAKR
jgi:hypothetical protein